MRTSTFLVGSLFVLVSGTGLAFTIPMLRDRQSCDAAIQQQTIQVRRDPYARLNDLSAVCGVSPAAQVLDRMISAK